MAELKPATQALKADPPRTGAPKNPSEGFTLVELMVVVLIIGILLAVAVPIFNAAKATAQQRVCYANQRTIEGAAQTYRAATGFFPGATPVDGSNVLITAHYLQHPPFCEALGSTAYYDLDASGTVNVPAGCIHGHF